MRRGWVTFTTGGLYMDLTEVLVQSLATFSTHPVTVFALNADVPFRYPNMDAPIRKNLENLDFGSICYEKLFASFANPYDAGVMLDADMVANAGVDTLIEEAMSVGEYPLGSLHPQDPDNQQEIMELLGVREKSQPYVHATYLFSGLSKAFLEDCYRTALWLQRIERDPPNADETVLNVKLWSVGATRYAPCYDPFFECIEPYIAGVGASEHNPHFSLDRSFIFHGCKDLARAQDIYARLRSHHGLRETLRTVPRESY